MIRARIQNFQSIEDVTLEIDRFTVFSGRSNIGKSASIRAITCALSNATGTHFVRHHPDCPKAAKTKKTCKCTTTVTLEIQGHCIRWEKGEGVSRYEVDGVLYDKTERGFPPFLEPLGLGPIQLGSLIQVSEQWQPLFLFGNTSAEVASVLGDVGDLPKVQQAVKAVEKDRRDAASTLKVRQQDRGQVETELQAYQGIDEQKAILERLQRERGRIEALETRIASLQRLREQYQSLSTLDDPLPLPTFPDLSRVQQLRAFQARHQALSSLEDPPPLPPFPDTSKVETLFRLQARRTPLKAKYVELSQAHKEVEQEISALDAEIKSIPVCPTCGKERL